MNNSSYSRVQDVVNKVEEYLWYRHYRDGVLDRNKITIYLGDVERKALISIYTQDSPEIRDNRFMGCKVIFVKEDSHFNIV